MSSKNPLLYAQVFLIFFLYVIYCIMRDAREALLLSANSAGASVIPFIKFWGMFPGALLLTALFARLCKSFGSEKSTSIFLSAMTSYFLIFAFVLYPNLETWCFVELSQVLMQTFPAGLEGMVNMICNWPVTIFYILSGTWATLVVSLMFWGCVNQVSSPKKASSSYGFIKIGGTLSASAGGLFAKFLQQNEYSPSLPFGKTAWEQTLMKETLFVSFLSLFSLFLFRKIYHSSHEGEAISKKEDKGFNISLRQSFQHILSSKYLSCMAILVVGYTFTYDLIDVLWKDQIHKAYSDPNDITAYLNNVTIIIGTISIFITLFSSKIIQRFGWSTLAIITPLSVAFGCFLFFPCLLLPSSSLAFGIPILSLSVFFGSLQSILSRAAKYSVFDVSKEIAYTPLPPEVQWNGKAAIDGVGNDVGRLGSGAVHQSVIILLGSLSASTPAVSLIVIATLVLWFKSVHFIGQEYHEKSEQDPPLSMQSA